MERRNCFFFFTVSKTFLQSDNISEIFYYKIGQMQVNLVVLQYFFFSNGHSKKLLYCVDGIQMDFLSPLICSYPLSRVFSAEQILGPA